MRTVVLQAANERGSGLVQLSVLPDGLRVVTEFTPFSEAASAGIWINAGARDEPRHCMGTAHLLEHLLFQGTRRYRAFDLARTLEDVGGELNSFTAHEYICVYANTLADHLDSALDVLVDMITSTEITRDVLDREKKLALTEIETDETDSDVAFDLFQRELMGDCRLGEPIWGTVESVKRLTRDDAIEFYHRYVVPKRTVVAVAGRIDHESTVELIGNLYANAGATGPSSAPAGPPHREPPALLTPGHRTKYQSAPLVNLVLGTRGYSRTDDRRFALAVLNCALGGTMSARLFQEVREKRALAYSVYSYTSQLADCGVFGITATCRSGNAREVISVVLRVLADIADKGLSAEEIDGAISSLIGSMELGFEDHGSKMTFIAKSQLGYPRHVALDELISNVAAVSTSQVQSIAQEILAAPIVMGSVGPIDRLELKLPR